MGQFDFGFNFPACLIFQVLLTADAHVNGGGNIRASSVYGKIETNGKIVA